MPVNTFLVQNGNVSDVTEFNGSITSGGSTYAGQGNLNGLATANGYHYACRFEGFNVPQFSSINSAVFRFFVTDAYKIPFYTLYVEDSADSAPINNSALITSRTKSSGSAVSQTIGTVAGSWDETDQYLDIDVTNIVQDHVNRQDWISGNAINFLVDTSADSISFVRDSSAASGYPELVIDYASDPAVGVANSGNPIPHDATGVVLQGVNLTGFSSLSLGYGGYQIHQSVTSSSATQIIFDVIQGDLPIGRPLKVILNHSGNQYLGSTELTSRSDTVFFEIENISASDPGSIFYQANQIALSDGSILEYETTSSNGNDVTVKPNGAILIDGGDTTDTFEARLWSQNSERWDAVSGNTGWRTVTFTQSDAPPTDPEPEPDPDPDPDPEPDPEPDPPEVPNPEPDIKQSFYTSMLSKLLPRSDVFCKASDNTMQRFIGGLESIESDTKNRIDKVWGVIFPETTDKLNLWEDQHGLISGKLSEENRRKQLLSAWRSQGGQSKDYIQSALDAAGFELCVYNWWPEGSEPVTGDNAPPTPRNGAQVLISGGYWLAGSDLTTEELIIPQCGENIAECGEEKALCGYFEGFITERIGSSEPQVPHYRSVFYIGSKSAWGDIETIDGEQKDQLETLVLKLSPAHIWSGMFVKYS